MKTEELYCVFTCSLKHTVIYGDGWGTDNACRSEDGCGPNYACGAKGLKRQRAFALVAETKTVTKPTTVAEPNNKSCIQIYTYTYIDIYIYIYIYISNIPKINIYIKSIIYYI